MRRAVSEPELAFEALCHQPQDGREVEERSSTADLPTGPREPRSKVLSAVGEDRCCGPSAATHCCAGRLVYGLAADDPASDALFIAPIGFFHIDIAEIPTEQGKLNIKAFVPRHRLSRTFAPLCPAGTKGDRRGAVVARSHSIP